MNASFSFALHQPPAVAALIACGTEFIIGHQDNPHAQLALRQALGVEDRHAMLILHEGAYRLIPLWRADRKCRHVALRGNTLDVAGDFVSHQSEISFGQQDRWRFQLPVPGSLTAVLEAMTDSQSSFILRGAHRTESFRRVILLADSCVLGNSEMPCHLCIPGLPVKVELLRDAAGIVARCTEAALSGSALCDDGNHLRSGELTVSQSDRSGILVAFLEMLMSPEHARAQVTMQIGELTPY